jgi:hypothetical protein
MIRSLVLFAHLAGVLALSAALSAEWLAFDAIRQATGRADAVRWWRLTTMLPRVFAMAFAVILASGAYLGYREGVLGDEWMRASYIALLLMAIVGGPATRRAMQALRRAAADHGDDGVTGLRAAASAVALRVSLRVRITFGLAVVYLMIAKPDVGDSFVALILALILAIAWAVWARPARAAFAEGYR